MNKAIKSSGWALTVAVLMSSTAAFADEASSTSIQSNNGTEAKSATYKAEVGAGGAKVSSEKNAVRANADGSVTQSAEKETHAMNAAGSAHTRSAASTTVAPDGSNTSIKTEHTSVH